MNSTCRSI